jgi:hypothetical protein
MKDKIAMTWSFPYTNELWYSPAYQSLNISARELLHSLINERRWTRKKGVINNGDISFTEVQFKERYGFCSATYLKARNKLIEVGLIKQTYRGGMARGDRATYRVLCFNNVLLKNQRWRRYPYENWSHKIPKRKKQMVGVDSQWKHGQSGRKTKATL